MLSDVGSVIAIAGSILSIVGTLYNNLKLNHHRAMLYWAISNPLLLVWAAGNSAEIWDGGLSTGSLAIMYAIFAITNIYGLYCYYKAMKND